MVCIRVVGSSRSPNQASSSLACGFAAKYTTDGKSATALFFYILAGRSAQQIGTLASTPKFVTEVDFCKMRLYYGTSFQV